jgi:hypothetical protein
MPLWQDFAVIAGFCMLIFFISVRNIHRKWIE